MPPLPLSLLTPEGRSGIRRSGGQILDEYLPELQGRRGRAVLTEMAHDPVLGGGLLVIDLIARGVEWSVDPADDSPAATRSADLVASAMQDMVTPWPDVVSGALTMIPFGWSWLETVYKKRSGPTIDAYGYRSQHTDGLLGWAELPHRAQNSHAEWLYADVESDRIIGWTQNDPATGKMRTLLRSRGLHFRTSAASDNPEGKSALRLAYRPWYLKRRVEEYEAIGIERDLAGLPMAEVPEEVLLGDDPRSADILAGVGELLRDVRRNETDGVVWPLGWDELGNARYRFSLMASGGARQVDTDKVISRYDQRCAMALLTDFMLIGHEGVGGGLGTGVADSKSDLFAAALETYLDRVGSEFNEVAVPDLLAVNGFPPESAPTLNHSPVQAPSLAELSQLLAAIAQAGGLPFPDEALMAHLYKRAGLPAPAAEAIPT
jgi:hypothetical protein